MSFGTERGTPVGGQTLTGFIVSKATQSRKEAKKVDRKDKKKKKKKEEAPDQGTNLKTKLLGSLPSLGNLFASKKAPTKSSASTTKTRSSGGGTGLAKILVGGFGSLTADTLAISSGLTAITQLLNNQFKAQSFTATGVQSIASILSDQLENQTSILSGIKNIRSGTGSGGPKGGFGAAKSAKTSGDTLTEFLIQQMIQRGVGKFLQGSLSKMLDPFKKLLPGGASKGAKPAAQAGAKGAEAIARQKLAQDITSKGLKSKGAIIGGKYISMTAAEAAQTLAPKATGPLAKVGGMFSGLGSKLGMKGSANLARVVPGVQTAVGLGLAGKELFEGDLVGAGLAGLSALPGPLGWGFLGADVAREVAGPQATDKMLGEALGGSSGLGVEGYSKMSGLERGMLQMSMPSLSQGGVMIGEAGREAVVDLNSNTAKKSLNNQKGDPGMKASGASTLAVVDQFIKGMGPLGAPVSQALGPDIQNLSRTFGMSQTLPNLKIGGGKFKEDGSAKKNRDKFLEKLISGSLEALDAKKKEDEQKQAPQTTPAGTVQEQQKQEEQQKTQMQSLAAANNTSLQQVTRDGEQILETTGAVKPVQIGTTGKNLFGQEEKVFAPGSDYRPVQGSDRKIWYDKSGQLYSWSQNGDKGSRFRPLTRQEKIDGWNGRTFLRNPTTGHVRVYQGMNPLRLENVAQGEYSYKYERIFVGQDGRNPSPNQNDTKDWKPATETSGVYGAPVTDFGVKSTEIPFEKGGGVQKPWWDFMGKFVDTHRNTKPQDYSNQKGLGASFARRRKALKELGYESGGSMFGTEFSSVNPLENRVAAIEEFISLSMKASVGDSKPKVAPRSSPAAAPMTATNQELSEMSSSAIINVISSAAPAPVTPPSESPQSSVDYISDPWPGGLAGVLCSSPWSPV